MGDIYVPLHVHTHHSILDGFATGHENADRAKAIGAPAVAMTDHGSCSGHWEHTLACRRNAIKPIYGIETYLVDSVKESKGRRDKPSDFAHACMWALTDEGLSNLWAASSIATDPDHMYYKPRMDFELLEKYHEGCAISDGCLLSTVAKAIVDDDLDRARAHLGRLVSIFGQENVLVELHTWQFINPLTDEHIELNRQMTKANKGKLKLAKELGLRTIAVNDSHYSVKDDYAYHEISWAGNKGRATDQIFDPDDDENDGVGGRGETASWMMTAEEVRLYLGRHGIPADDIDDAIDNTVWLANRCNAHIESHARFPLMTGTEDGDSELFDKMLEEGFKKKVPHGKEAEYRERLEYEKSIIKGSHFPGYFNTVADYIKYCKEPDHAGVRGPIVGKEPTITGAGRGSGAGSLCTYLLDITEVDPIPFGLYFERFLTPARKMEDGWSVWYDDGTEDSFRPSDMPEGLKTGSEVDSKTVTGVFPAAIGEFPDIDSDFPSSFGDDMIRYLEKRHGRDNVAHLGNFLYTRPKSTFRTISKAFGVKDQKFVSEITDRFMDELNDDDFLDEDKKILDEAKDLSPAHRKLINRVWPHMQRMRSRVRALGTHASGVIIANEPLLGAIPLRWANDGWVTAFDHGPTEALGYIKYDVLKVTSLDILDLTAQLAVQDRKVFREVWDDGTEHYLPKELLRDPDNAEVVTEPTIKVVTEASNGWFNDPDVWERTCQGDSFGLFQLETDSGQGFAKRMQIKNVDDAALLSAVNRPGVVRAGLIDTFFKRRDGFERVTYPHPMLEQIIGDTGGLFVFQESVLQMFQLMCGYSLEQADGVRKIITKKKVKEMPRLHDEFVEACRANPHFVSQVPKRFRSVEDCCEEVWEMMVHTAEYSFGKGHAVAYAYTSGWGAYMKTYFLPEFVAAAMTYKQNDLVKTASYSKRVGIPVLGPDINLSSWRYTIEDDSVRLPLSQVPNVGGSAMEDILAGQPYKDFEDYCERTSNSKGRKVNVLKNLVLAGAFDSFNPDRTEMYRDAMAAKGRKDDEPPIMRTRAQVAKVEEELLGLPISYDPMNEVEGHFKGYAVKSIDEVTSTPVGGSFFAYGKVTKISRHKAKSGWMAWVELRLKDFSILSVTVFPSMFAEVAHLFSESDVLLVKCRRDKDYNGRLSVICDQLVNFTDYLE